MADDTKKSDGEGKKSPLKMIIIFAVVLLGEAGMIIGAMMMISKPAEVGAAGSMPAIALSEDEKIVETQVLDAKLPNSRTGATYIYSTEIYVQSKRRHEESILSELEQFQNEIKSEITAIWRTSDPHHFQEPRLETLTRKVYALLNARFGTDEATGEPIIRKCVLVMGTGFRIAN